MSHSGGARDALNLKIACLSCSAILTHLGQGSSLERGDFDYSTSFAFVYLFNP